MKWYDRTLLAILAVMGAVFGICLISVAVGWPLNEAALKGITSLCQEKIVRIVIAVLAVIALAICARLLWVATKKQTDFRKSHLLVETTEYGQTLISKDAIANIVQKLVKENRKIHFCKTTVKAQNGKNDLTVQLVVTDDTPITELTRELQKTIKDNVEKSSGIEISEVYIIVKNTSGSNSQRVD